MKNEALPAPDIAMAIRPPLSNESVRRPLCVTAVGLRAGGVWSASHGLSLNHGPPACPDVPRKGDNGPSQGFGGPEQVAVQAGSLYKAHRKR
jgi:hypothetical protein